MSCTTIRAHTLLNAVVIHGYATRKLCNADDIHVADSERPYAVKADTHYQTVCAEALTVYPPPDVVVNRLVVVVVLSLIHI